MNILSLDTAMGACSVAVIDTDSSLILAECCVPMERGHADEAVRLMQEHLDHVQAGLTFDRKRPSHDVSVALS